jgi:hypothetical protein
MLTKKDETTKSKNITPQKDDTKDKWFNLHKVLWRT